MRDSVSSMSDSQDGDMSVMGQQPTGIVLPFDVADTKSCALWQLTCNMVLPPLFSHAPGLKPIYHGSHFSGCCWHALTSCAFT